MEGTSNYQERLQESSDKCGLISGDKSPPQTPPGEPLPQVSYQPSIHQEICENEYQECCLSTDQSNPGEDYRASSYSPALISHSRPLERRSASIRSFPDRQVYQSLRSRGTDENTAIKPEDLLSILFSVPRTTINYFPRTSSLSGSGNRNSRPLYLQFTSHDTNQTSYTELNELTMVHVERLLKEHRKREDIDHPENSPLDATKLNLSSSFRVNFVMQPNDEYKFLQNLNSTRKLHWSDGFDAALFAKSHRLLATGGISTMPDLVRYSHSSSRAIAQEFYENEYFQRREAYQKLKSETPFNPGQSNAPLPPGFSRLATAFFNGNIIDSRFDDLSIGDDIPPTGPPNHVITYIKTPWTEYVDKMRGEAEKEANDQNPDNYKPAGPFKNKSHGAMGLFLQDVIRSNTLEASCASKTAYDGVKITHSQEYIVVSEQLRKLERRDGVIITMITPVNLKIVNSSSASDCDEGETENQLDYNFDRSANQLLGHEENNSNVAIRTKRKRKSNKGKVKRDVIDVQASGTDKSDNTVQQQVDIKVLGNQADIEFSGFASPGALKQESTLKLEKSSHHLIFGSLDNRELATNGNTRASEASQPTPSESKEPLRQESIPGDNESSAENKSQYIGFNDGWHTVKSKKARKPQGSSDGNGQSEVPQIARQNSGQQKTQPKVTIADISHQAKAPSQAQTQMRVPTNTNLRHKSMSKPQRITYKKKNLHRQLHSQNFNVPVFDELHFPAISATVPKIDSKGNIAESNGPQHTPKVSYSTSPKVNSPQFSGSSISASTLSTFTLSTILNQQVEGVISVVEPKLVDGRSTAVKHLSQNDSCLQLENKLESNADNLGKHLIKCDAPPLGHGEEPRDSSSVATLTKGTPPMPPTAPPSSSTDNLVNIATFHENPKINSDLSDATDAPPAKEQVYEALAWAGESLTSPSHFESGSRRKSLPGTCSRPEYENSMGSPQLSHVRHRSQSLGAVDIESGEEAEEQAVQEGDASTTEGNIMGFSLYRINGDFARCIPGPTDKNIMSSTVGSARNTPAENQHADSLESTSTLDERPLCGDSSPLNPKCVDRASHVVPAPIYHQSGDPGLNSQFTYRIHGQNTDSAHQGGEAVQRLISNGQMRPNFTAESELGFSLNDKGSKTTRASAPLNNPVLLAMPSYCSFCRDLITPSIERPLVLCSGCGFEGNIRYCSLACLLVDAYDHTGQCVNYPTSTRAVSLELPSYFIYERNPIMASITEPDSKEKFRQKAFAMYCKFGEFPRLLTSWAKRYPHANGTEAFERFQDIETRKRTGDYFVFSSRATSASARLNPKADVIFTLVFSPGHPIKNIFNRCLNASFLCHQTQLVEFLFRLIRSFIIDPRIFMTFPHCTSNANVLIEFNYQFRREFGFDADMQVNPSDFFAYEVELIPVLSILASMEAQYPVLQYWNRY